VLCIGARNRLDEAAAAMLAHLLIRREIGAATVSCRDIAGRNMARLPRQGVALICLSYVNPRATQHAHRLIRRLRHHFGDQPRILVGLWATEASPEPREGLLETTGADLLAASLRQAARQIQDVLEPERPEATPSAA
jgi:hypothetical protein